MNLPSDFASLNPIKCDYAAYRICRFVDSAMAEIVIRNIGSTTDEPSLYTGRPTWLRIQSECGDLRQVKAHPHQGTRSSKKLTFGIIKRYLQRAIIAKDSLLVVHHDEPFSRSRDLIIIPWHVVYSIVLVLHLQLAHPSVHQLKMVFHRYFFALDADQIIIETRNKCHQCVATRLLPEAPKHQCCSSCGCQCRRQCY